MTEIYDYIIIGSGFGGSVSALRLAEKGYKVLVIEQGKRYGHSDFPRTNMNLFKYLWMPSLRMFGIQKMSFYKDASILTGVGVGGGSLVYANTLFRPPDEFFENNAWSAFRDWKKELTPFYELASRMLGRTKYDKLNAEDEYLKQTARDFGREESFKSVDVGVYLGDTETEADPYFSGLGPLRKGCIECGGCMTGCREDAKNSLDKNYLYFAGKYGAEIIPETKAYRISRQGEEYIIETKRITGFFRKRKNSFRTKGIIISAGTLGSMELLLKQKYKYGTLTQLSGKLGHEVRTNSETLCAVSSGREKLNNGLAISSVFNPDDNTHIEVVKYGDGSNAMKAFFGLSVKGAENSFKRTMLLFRKTLANPEKFLKVLFNFKWATGAVIFLVMQGYDNAMKLVWKKGLAGGRMKIDNSGNRSVPAYIDIGQKTMEHYAKLSGTIPQNILLEVLFNRPTTAHILGGCPMGDSKETGVIGTDFKVFGMPDFYIVDGSVIQGNPGVNPSLTITALAEYAMSQIPEKKGNTNKSLDEQIQTVSSSISMGQ